MPDLDPATLATLGTSLLGAGGLGAVVGRWLSHRRTAQSDVIDAYRAELTAQRGRVEALESARDRDVERRGQLAAAVEECERHRVTEREERQREREEDARRCAEDTARAIAEVREQLRSEVRGEVRRTLSPVAVPAVREDGEG